MNNKQENLPVGQVEIKVTDVDTEKMIMAFEAVEKFLRTNFMQYRNADGLSAAQKITIRKKENLFGKPKKIFDIFTCATKEGFKVSFSADRDVK